MLSRITEASIGSFALTRRSAKVESSHLLSFRSASSLVDKADDARLLFRVKSLDLIDYLRCCHDGMLPPRHIDAASHQLSVTRKSALTTWIKHGAAAIRAATMACILSFERGRDRFVHLELIIVRQFFARADVA